MPRVVAGLAGLAWFIGFGGGKALDPTRIDWAMNGDWAQHVLGWLFFRNAEWSWPPGTFDTLVAPAGTSVGLTDSLPWLALLLKPLAFLPADFQYVGLWLAVCFVLQGIFGVRLLQGIGASPPVALAGGCLLVLTPVLAHRIWHEALCAHWLLLAMLHLLAVDPKAVRAPVVQVALFPLLATGIHPYLTAMTVALTLGVLTRWSWIDGFMDRRRALAIGLACCALVPALWWIFGYLEPGSAQGATGFNYYSADLLAFIDSMNRSRLLPRLPDGQYEGFAYLGLGNLVLSTVAVGLIWRRRDVRQVFRSPRVRIALVVCGAMALFALSSRVTLAGEVVLSMRRAYTPLELLTTSFRASGRFIWPLYYLVIVGTIILLARCARWPRRAVTAILLVAVAVQVWDLSDYLRWDRFPAQNTRWLEDPAWEGVRQSYDVLIALPPPLRAATPFQCAGAREFESADIPLAHLAYRLDLTFNGGSVARVDPEAVEAGCDAVEAPLLQCRLDPRTVYVVSGTWRSRLEACEEAQCGRVEGLSVCVRRGNSDPFARLLASRKDDPKTHALETRDGRSAESCRLAAGRRAIDSRGDEQRFRDGSARRTA